MSVQTLRRVNIKLFRNSKRDSNLSLPEQSNKLKFEKTSNSSFSYREILKKMSRGTDLDSFQRPRLRTFSSLKKEGDEDDCLTLSKSLSEFYIEITKISPNYIESLFITNSDWGSDEIRCRLMTA
jgi:hypothetical protein